MEPVQTNQKSTLSIIDYFYNLPKVLNLLENIFPVLKGIYFRSEMVGFDTLPEKNQYGKPHIYVSNHSGMCFPWDAMIFGAEWLAKARKENEEKEFRALVAPMLTATNLMNPYMLENFWEEMGGVSATFKHFDMMMELPKADVLIYPEGVPGIGKGFNRKYQYQPLATSFIRMSLKYKTDIVPFATVNAEYLNPYSYSFDGINQFSKKIGIPFFPIGIFTFLMPLQPWIFYFSLPAKMTYIRGEIIKPYEWIDKPYEEISQEEIESIRKKIHHQLQSELTAGVKEYGKKPYRWRELWKTMWKKRRYFPFYFPFCWPFMFLEFERQYRKNKGAKVHLDLNFSGFIKMFFNNPLGWCYFIPIIGWIPLLIRGYRQKRKSRLAFQNQ